MSVNSFSQYIDQLIGNTDPYDATDKKAAIAQHIRYMLMRTQCMFEWSGLPDTIPARQLELLIQTHGHACITEVNGKLYAISGGLGGEPDPYYQPTVYTVANPGLKYSATLEIGKDCILIRNDVLYAGLVPMFRKYATFLAEVELSLDMANVNSRQEFLITAKDDRTKQAAEKFLQDLRDGKAGAIGDTVLESLRTQPYSATGSHVLTDLIELNQYWKASWLNDLGLN